MVALTYISVKAVGRGFNHGRIWGEVYWFKAPNEFFTIQKLKFIKQYNTISCHEANQNHRRRLGGARARTPK